MLRSLIIIVPSLPFIFTNHHGENIFCIGGGQMYQATIDKADKLYITYVDRDIPGGDAFFPKIGKEWKPVFEEIHQGFRYVNYERA